MTDQHRQALLDAAADYVRAKLALANAIIAARSASAGHMTDEETVELTGLSPAAIRSALSRL